MPGQLLFFLIFQIPLLCLPEQDLLLIYHRKYKGLAHPLVQRRDH